MLITSYNIMKQLFLVVLIPILFQSCIPLTAPPNLEKGKVFQGNKFNKRLPNQRMYIFTDPKNADEFYYYISSKFAANMDGDSETNVPVTIDNKKYYVTFYETEKNATSINLLPIIANAALERNNIAPSFNEGNTIKRDGTWYIALVITDEDYNDALDTDYKAYSQVLQFSKNLQNDYLSTTNYNSLLLKQ